MIEAIRATQTHQCMARMMSEDSSVTYRILEEQLIGILRRWDAADVQRLFRRNSNGLVVNLADAIERARNRVFGYESIKWESARRRRLPAHRGRDPVAADIAYHGRNENE